MARYGRLEPILTDLNEGEVTTQALCKGVLTIALTTDIQKILLQDLNVIEQESRNSLT